MMALRADSRVAMVWSRAVISASRAMRRSRRGGFGGRAQGQQELDQAFGIKVLGDVDIPEGVAPLRGEEGRVGGGR